MTDTQSPHVLTSIERDVLCHVLAEEQAASLPLHERFANAEAVSDLIDRGMIRRPAGGGPFLMLTEVGREAAGACSWGVL